jgi:hypothetical protein
MRAQVLDDDTRFSTTASSLAIQSRISERNHPIWRPRKRRFRGKPPTSINP